MWLLPLPMSKKETKYVASDFFAGRQSWAHSVLNSWVCTFPPHTPDQGPKILFSPTFRALTPHCIAWQPNHSLRFPFSIPSHAVSSPAVVSPDAPDSDGLYGLHVENTQVLRVHQCQVLTVQVHVQVLSLQKTSPSYILATVSSNQHIFAGIQNTSKMYHFTNQNNACNGGALYVTQCCLHSPGQGEIFPGKNITRHSHRPSVRRRRWYHCARARGPRCTCWRPYYSSPGSDLPPRCAPSPRIVRRIWLASQCRALAYQHSPLTHCSEIWRKQNNEQLTACVRKTSIPWRVSQAEVHKLFHNLWEGDTTTRPQYFPDIYLFDKLQRRENVTFDHFFSADFMKASVFHLAKQVTPLSTDQFWC